MAAFPLVALLLSLGAGLTQPATSADGALYADAPDGMYLLDSGWTGRADARDVGQRHGWWREGKDQGFAPVSIPNAFNANRRDSAGFHAGIYWYRERFRLQDDPLATSWRFRFEGIGRRALVYLNGRYVGAAAGAFLPSEVAATGVRPGDNELVVRVDGRPRGGELPPAGRPMGWWNYAGLLREVYLRRVAALDMADVQVTTRLNGAAAGVQVGALLRNTTRAPIDASLAPVQLKGPTDAAPRDVAAAEVQPATIPPGGLAHVRASFTIEQAKLWSPRLPSLYELTLRVAGGQRTTTQFGVREWRRTRGGRVLLNGKPITLSGASFHEQALGHGAALTPLDRAGIVSQLTRLGANLTREHYPPHPALLDAFDRLGIAYWEEIPVWRLRAKQLRSPLADRALAMLRATILRDRNHPSVMVWSVENETLRGGRAEAAYLQKARALVRGLDPTRFLGAAVPLEPVRALNPALRTVDALGLNDYLGWYGGRVSDVPRELAAVRSRFPHQALFATEFGAEADRPGSANEKGTYAFQRRFLLDQIAMLRRVPALNGMLAWILRDFLVHPGWRGGNPRPHPPRSAKGLLHADGRDKPAFDAVREAFAAAHPGGAP
jgi:beta-glucuronidase